MNRKPKVQTDDVFRALADPVRRSILSHLHQRPQPVSALATQYKISRPAISRHLKVLRECGVVSHRTLGSENIYYLNAAPLHEVQDWLKQFWSARLGDFKAVAEEADN